MVINTLLDLFLHLDKNMGAVIQSYGMWTYLILFAIVFAETGFVITPFLPGDSLLFVTGAFSASGSLSLQVAVIILGAADGSLLYPFYRVSLVSSVKKGKV